MVSAVPVGGRRRKQLRSAARTFRERRPAVRSREGDPELVAVVEEPYSTGGEAYRGLRELLDAFEARGDRRAVFLSIYAEMTGEVLERVKQDGFDDSEWVREYLVAFANRYRRAVYEYERGELESVADPWQIAFDAAERGDSLILQDAMLGVNAHINYDLAHAIRDVSVQPDRETKYEDHSTVTDVIAAVVDDAQELLVEYGADGVEAVDASLGRLDEAFTVLTIDECRDSAWRTAIGLDSRFSVRRRVAAWINDVTATGAAYLILSTKASDRVHETLVDAEGSTGARS